MQFDHQGTKTAVVQWYFAADGAKYFEGPHLFGSSKTWSIHGQPGLGPGEYWDSDTPYYNGAMPAYFPGTGGFCGDPDWWVNGVPFDAPPLDYSTGVPPCCPQPLCQPFFPANAANTTVTSVNPSYDFVFIINSGSSVEFFTATDDADGQTIPDGGACGAAISGTAITIVFATGPPGGLMTLTAFDPSTYTGTYVGTPASDFPPGFKIFLTSPP